MQEQILRQHKWRDQEPETKKWWDQTQFMRSIKSIKITKMKDSTSQVIAYSHKQFVRRPQNQEETRHFLKKEKGASK